MQQKMNYKVSRNKDRESFTVFSKQTENGYEARYVYVNRCQDLIKEYKSQIFRGKTEYDAVNNLIYFAKYYLANEKVMNPLELPNKAWKLFFDCNQPMLEGMGINPNIAKCMEK